MTTGPPTSLHTQFASGLPPTRSCTADRPLLLLRQTLQRNFFFRLNSHRGLRASGPPGRTPSNGPRSLSLVVFVIAITAVCNTNWAIL
jgi:hypothetical protein